MSSIAIVSMIGNGNSGTVIRLQAQSSDAGMPLPQWEIATMATATRSNGSSATIVKALQSAPAAPSVDVHKPAKDAAVRIRRRAKSSAKSAARASHALMQFAHEMGRGQKRRTWAQVCAALEPEFAAHGADIDTISADKGATMKGGVRVDIVLGSYGLSDTVGDFDKAAESEGYSLK